MTGFQTCALPIWTMGGEDEDEGEGEGEGEDADEGEDEEIGRASCRERV